MAVQIQLRRGTTAEHSTFTGAIGEITIDTTKNVAVIHNGSVAGGFPLALASGSFISASGLVVNNNLNISSGSAYLINNTSVLSTTTLGSTVVNSSLTSVGTLTSLTVSGDLTVDTSTLKVDSGGNRVGVLTATPQAPLHVRGTTDGNFWVREASIMASGLTGTGVSSVNDAANDLVALSFQAKSFNLVTDNTLRATLDNSGNLAVDTSTLFVDAVNNRVGVGTVTPDGALDVSQGMTNGSTGAFTTPHLALTATSSTDTTGFVGMTMAASDTVNYGWSYGALRSNGGISDLIWKYHFNSAAGTEFLRLTSSGNLGLGVTPSAWGSGQKAFEVGYKGNGIVNLGSVRSVNIVANAYNDGAWKYANDFDASWYQCGPGHTWYNAPSGLTGNAISFVQAMTLDANGNLGVGVTSINAKLEIAGRARLSGSQVGNVIENQPTAISVTTSAVTILDDAGGLGRLCVINGISSGDRFCDLVLASTSVAPTVVQSFSAAGSPAARTYTRSGSALQLAMASGTYDVFTLAFGY